MSNAKKSLKKRRLYDKEKLGMYGSMGNGSIKINFIQFNMSISALDSIGLVSEIPGSEKWPVRQLFQRDIDQSRVEQEIMPYFEDPNYVKFFNPLTIAVLPIDSHGRLRSSLKEEEDNPAENFQKAFSVSGFYKVSYDEEDPPQALLEWNTEKIKLIAIDGQHRLSALKRLKDKLSQNPSDEKLTNVDFTNWSIPIALLTMGHAADISTTPAVIEKTRQIFVTINVTIQQKST
jgi:hypothetical protein